MRSVDELGVGQTLATAIFADLLHSLHHAGTDLSGEDLNAMAAACCARLRCTFATADTTDGVFS